MITDRQLDFILNLYEEIGQEPEIGIENLSKTDARKAPYYIQKPRWIRF